MSLTAARQVWVMLREAGPRGVHSLEIRRSGTSGNPSQRLREIAAHGVEVRKRRESIGRRPGIRAWLAEYAPPDAERVNPDGSPGGLVGASSPDEAAPEVVLSWTRDYTDPDGEWELRAA